MPRDSNGVHSLPSGTLVNPGDVVQPSQHNPAMQDISQALSASLDRQGRGGMQADLQMNGRKVVDLAPATQPGDAVRFDQISSGIPLGVEVGFWGNTPPPNFMFCAGQELSRTEYAELFAVIGTNAGPGNGSTTFNLPDFRGRVGAGRDNMGGADAGRLSSISGQNMGATGGSQTHTLTEAEMAAHTHTGSTASAGAHTHNYQVLTTGGSDSGPLTTGSRYIDIPTSSAGAHTHSMNLNNTGGGQGHNNLQPTIVRNVIMRVR